MRTQMAMAMVAVSAGVAAGQTEVFFTNFDSAIPAEISGAGGLESVAGLAGAGHPGNQFAGNLLRNDGLSATRLTLTGLPTHDRVSVSLLAALIDSWDSDNGSVTPDYFNIVVDGVTYLTITTNNASGSNSYAGDLIYSGHAGWNGGWIDRAWDMTPEALLQNIPHTSSTLTIDFFASGAGYQGGGDESWAIDNLRVTVDGVPAPSAGLAVLGGLGLLARRRRA